MRLIQAAPASSKASALNSAMTPPGEANAPSSRGSTIEPSARNSGGRAASTQAE